ncbi:MAG: response regulator transcription factor [Saprospiraceae bacterium]|nr:response regulator transcription factor [Candidatus Brachybacter algidus]
MNKTKIFYVEDDETLAFLTTEALSNEGFQVDHFTNGLDALNAFRKSQFDICLLDVMLPKMDGFELAKKIRENNNSIPIIFLTAKSMLDDKIEGLTIGGDDYIIKPFDMRELLLKVDIFLNRRGKIASLEDIQIAEFGNYTFDYINLTLHYNDISNTLTQKEGDLLRYFSDHRNTLIKRSEILEELWGRNDYFLGRSLDVFISRLRKYLSNDERLRIENVHGVGFRFHVDA